MGVLTKYGQIESTYLPWSVAIYIYLQPVYSTGRTGLETTGISAESRAYTAEAGFILIEYSV
jgi:hypothetical protein